MVILKTKNELQLMQKAGAITAAALHAGGAAVKPGVTTKEIDKIIHDYIVSHGAVPSFLGYGGFPASACISVNDEVIHGIPGNRVLQEGDIVSIDVGAKINGYHGDSAYTFPCGKIDAETQKLLDGTKKSLENAIAQAVVGNRLGDISYAVQSTVEPMGLSVVREYVGHGVGRDLHEAPEVPNYGTAGRGIRLAAGMVLAIEPMINAGGWPIKVLGDGWTVKTRDGKMSAHFEHTVAITQNGPVILTELK
ncbi:MAG: type I methionyl aminopeptidase [Oscillospiraceae bacterium]|nr:type I methionyl aminopeptidase [Oscillospiraceae bacterium]